MVRIGNVRHILPYGVHDIKYTIHRYINYYLYNTSSFSYRNQVIFFIIFFSNVFNSSDNNSNSNYRIVMNNSE